MNGFGKLGKILCALAVGSIPLFAIFIARAADDDYQYLVGRGIADVTGPPVGLQLWGFVRQDQIAEGIHFRLFSRAFVIAERNGDGRIAFASVDLGSITHAVHLEVVDKLQARYGDLYTDANVILSATHTHSGPGGFWLYGADSPIGAPFYGDYFDAIVDGITASIVSAHEDLQPGAVYAAHGDVVGAGANRSMTAYLNNPEDERARYAGPTDTGMTLLKFVDASGAIGSVNWFASHPTAMNFYNKLISGDHKGHASALFEAAQGAGFVAAFAQSNAGDVTPNLNLNNTGPGETDIETTRIIAERQFNVALELFAKASERLEGPIDVRHAYVNFHNLDVADAFTGAGPQRTCPSAYGYAFAAGSTEDGGGNPLFHEGMKTRNAMIDGVVADLFKLPEPSEGCRTCQQPKVILFAPGEQTPPLQSQVLPLTVARIGQLTLVCVPSEMTTMSGRRIRETIADIMGGPRENVVIVGYANDYGGYVTTREEYETQQYEGGHTLFGPWTLAAYQQELARLATALNSGESVEPGELPRDMRGQVASAALEAPTDVVPRGAAPGDVADDAKKRYTPGATLEVAFWSGDPRNGYPGVGRYLYIERHDDATGDWRTVATDNDWSTQIRWQPAGEGGTMSRLNVTWEIPEGTAPGSYRIRHDGRFKDAKGVVSTFSGVTRTFRVR